jgi:hypothetical protein
MRLRVGERDVPNRDHRTFGLVFPRRNGRAEAERGATHRLAWPVSCGQRPGPRRAPHRRHRIR